MGRTKKTVIEKAVKAPKLTFVDKVISASKAENPDNLEKFQERAIRYADREIQAIEDKLIDAKTAVKDSKDIVTEASLKVDLKSITSIAGINSYMPEYVCKIEDAMNEVNAKISAVERFQKRIDFFNTFKKLVK